MSSSNIQVTDPVEGSVYEIIKKIGKDSGSGAYVVPDIPERKLNGSIKGTTKGKVDPEDVYLVIDQTLFGSASEGLLFTADTLYIKKTFADPFFIKYIDITDCYVRQIVEKDKNDKENITKYVIISYKNSTYRISKIGIDVYKLARLIKSIAISVNKSKESKAVITSDATNSSKAIKRIPLDEMPVDLRIAYIKVINLMFLSDDDKIDAKELSELYLLIARLKLSPEERFTVLAYQKQNDNVQDILNSQIKPLLEESAYQEVIQSLVKDMLFMYRKTKSQEWKNSDFITTFAKVNNISEEQISVLNQAIDNDLKIFDDNADDSVLEQGFREIASNAAAVGVPIAAIYLSGSVVGLSAAGITSGLTALGFGGLFGFASSMVTGIGAVILLGVGAKKGVEALTGQKEIDRRKKKELMLLQLNKQLQRTVNMIMEDINQFANKLAQSIADNNKNQETISILLDKLKNLVSSGQIVANETKETARLAILQKVPRTLNVDRLAIITEEPTKKKYYNLIIHCYQKE